MTTNEELRKKRIAFLEEMIAYYSEDTSRRSVSPNGKNCLYRCGDKKCAIGRYIPDDKYDKFIESSAACSDIVMKRLPEDVKELGKFFLRSVQELHDASHFWTTNGLSEQGEQKKQKIINIYATEDVN